MFYKVIALLTAKVSVKNADGTVSKRKAKLRNVQVPQFSGIEDVRESFGDDNAIVAFLNKEMSTGAGNRAIAKLRPYILKGEKISPETENEAREAARTFSLGKVSPESIILAQVADLIRSGQYDKVHELLGVAAQQSNAA